MGELRREDLSGVEVREDVGLDVDRGRGRDTVGGHDAAGPHPRPADRRIGHGQGRWLGLPRERHLVGVDRRAGSGRDGARGLRGGAERGGGEDEQQEGHHTEQGAGRAEERH